MQSAYAWRMHVHNTAPHEHDHRYVSGHELENERRTWYVVGLTAIMMAAEILCGMRFNSMALLADGWHMATHVGALGIAGLAYFMARKHAQSRYFSFGTGKMNALGGFTSATILALIAVGVAGESVWRLIHPSPIVFNDAIFVALLGLAVNIVCARLLKEEHSHAHGHDHPHHDHNMRAAYTHVLADAVTSIFAVGALLLGKYFGWHWADPLMGIIGSVVILNWSWSLMRRASFMLLDFTPDPALEEAVREAIEHDSDNKVADYHLWQVAPGKISAIISLVTHEPKPPKYYKALLKDFPQLVHVTVEVNKCE